MATASVPQIQSTPTTKTETPDTVHGRLMEGVHIAGYTFERACGELEWLLTGDRWKAVGGGYTDINAFLKTIDLSEFRLALEQRKKLAKRLADIEASQRATARLLGVDKETIARDLEKRSSGANAPPTNPQSQKHEEISEPEREVGANAPPAWFQTDADPTRDAKRVVAKRERVAKREAEEQTALTIAATVPVNERADLRVCGMEVLLSSLHDLDAIVTDPPYGEEALPLYGELARLGAVALKPSGVLAVMCGQSHLPVILAAMTPHIRYRWTMAYLTPGGQSPQIWPRKVNTFWKPVLVFGAAEEWMGDVVRSDPNDNDKRFHHWGQSESGMARLVEVLTKPDALICDPFLGGGTTAVVSLALGRRFIGADLDAGAVALAKQRITNA